MTNLEPHTTSESALIHRAKKGDQRALEELYVRNWDRMYRTAIRMIGNDHEAEEVVQSSFEVAFQTISRFDERSSFTTWCYRITTNKCLDFIRKKERRRKYLVESDEFAERTLPEDPTRTEHALMRQELRRIIEDALGKLAPNIRTVIILKDQSDAEPTPFDVQSKIRVEYQPVMDKAKGRREFALLERGLKDSMSLIVSQCPDLAKAKKWTE